MKLTIPRISLCMWFDDQAEAAAAYYTSIFANARIVAKTHYAKEASQVAGRPEGSVMTVSFELDGHSFTALNGGPLFKFNESMSIVVNCKTQEEIDHYWSHLSQGGDEKAQQCGWLKDKFGVSWQIVYAKALDVLGSGDAEKSRKVMAAILKMKKMDVETLERAMA